MIRKLLLSTALTLAALPALARENHALLIGASEYVNLAEKWWLKGPKNDVELIDAWLRSQSPVPFQDQNITILTDGIEGVETATLANIRKAFAKLTEEVEAGDFVYLHLSGHGTQAPAKDPDSEIDGLDELFLPVDIGPWNNTVGEVENALVDDEIGLLIDAIRMKGADVWVVIDSCHSGTATRAVESDEEVRLRQLDDEALSALGIPDAPNGGEISRGAGGSAPREAGADFGDAGAGAPGMGSLTAFYAAQTNEATPEKNLPKGQPDRKPMGVFTFTLFETLAEFPGATYGQVAQEVMRKYAVKNLARSTPLFEGEMDRVVFGGEARPRVAQWPATVEGAGFTIPAGALHGLSLGAEMALMPNAASGDDAALGLVRITSIDTFNATAELVGDAPADLPKGLYLRKADAALDFTLSVALPPAGSAPADALLSALEDLKAASGPRLNFVAAGAEADLQLAVLPESERPEAIWILPGTGIAEDLATTPSVDTAGRDGKAVAGILSESLTTMAKALNLMKLGAAIGPGNLEMAVEVQTRNAEDRTLRGLPVTPVPTLVANDEVHVLAANNTGGPVDVNVLYVGADYSISHWYAGRLQPGDTLKKGLFAIGGETMGQERMIVVATPVPPGKSVVENLDYLAQDALEFERKLELEEEGARGPTISVFEAAMQDAGFGETTRGAIPLGGDPETGPVPMILQIELRTSAE